MASFKLTLALGLLLCSNLVLVSSRAFGDDDDDDFGDLFGNSEEKSEESQEEEEYNEPAVVASRAIPPPVAPPKEPEPEKDSLQWDDSEETDQETNNNNEDHDSHHHHHHHDTHDGLSAMKSLDSQQQQPQQQEKQLPPVPAQAPLPNQQWGGNRLGFNESCNPSSDSCNAETNLRCHPTSRVCTCIDSYTYVRGQERCFPIPVGDQRCEFNEQCHSGKWGRLSRCNRERAQCECYDIDGYGTREMTQVKGVCVIKKNIYESCSNATDCVSIEGAVICDYPDASVDPGRAEKQCRCDRGHIWEPRMKRCLQLAVDGLASECMADDQCTLSSLGELSRCSRESTKCECFDSQKPGEEFVVFYRPRGRCFGRKDWNDTCREHDECRASISSKAECLPNPDGSQETTCQCPGGKVCKRDADGSAGVGMKGSMFTVVVFITTLVYGRFV